MPIPLGGNLHHQSLKTTTMPFSLGGSLTTNLWKQPRCPSPGRKSHHQPLETTTMPFSLDGCPMLAESRVRQLKIRAKPFELFLLNPQKTSEELHVQPMHAELREHGAATVQGKAHCRLSPEVGGETSVQEETRASSYFQDWCSGTSAPEGMGFVTSVKVGGEITPRLAGLADTVRLRRMVSLPTLEACSCCA